MEEKRLTIVNLTGTDFTLRDTKNDLQIVYTSKHTCKIVRGIVKARSSSYKITDGNWTFKAIVNTELTSDIEFYKTSLDGKTLSIINPSESKDTLYVVPQDISERLRDSAFNIAHLRYDKETGDAYLAITNLAEDC